MIPQHEPPWYGLPAVIMFVMIFVAVFVTVVSTVVWGIHRALCETVVCRVAPPPAPPVAEWLFPSPPQKARDQ